MAALHGVNLFIRVLRGRRSYSIVLSVISLLGFHIDAPLGFTSLARDVHDLDIFGGVVVACGISHFNFHSCGSLAYVPSQSIAIIMAFCEWMMGESPNNVKLFFHYFFLPAGSSID